MGCLQFYSFELLLYNSTFYITIIYITILLFALQFYFLNFYISFLLSPISIIFLLLTILHNIWHFNYNSTLFIITLRYITSLLLTCLQKIVPSIFTLHFVFVISHYFVTIGTSLSILIISIMNIFTYVILFDRSILLCQHIFIIKINIIFSAKHFYVTFSVLRPVQLFEV